MKSLLIREMILSLRQLSHLANAILFYLMMIFFFPLMLPYNPLLLQKMAPGLISLALLFTILLATQSIFTDDEEDGVIEQWLVSQQRLMIQINVKLFTQWLVIVIPLILTSPLLALLFQLNWGILLLNLMFTTPCLVLLVSFSAALNHAKKNQGMLMGLLVLPLALPILIFSGESLSMSLSGQSAAPQLALLLALSLFSMLTLPVATKEIIRLGFSD